LTCRARVRTSLFHLQGSARGKELHKVSGNTAGQSGHSKWENSLCPVRRRLQLDNHTQLHRPVVVGAMCVDIKGRPTEPLVAHTSNIGKVRWRAGGVAFNIACNLARLSCRPHLVSVVGNDAHGLYLLTECERLEVEVDRVGTLAAHRTPVYLAVLDERGDLEVAIADMEICDAVKPDMLEPHRSLLEAAPLILADTNLPAETLSWLSDLCRQRGIPLWVEPTTADKCARLQPFLDGITYLSPNEEELETLVGSPLRGADELRAAATELRARGVGHVFVTRGPEGVLWVGPEGTRSYASRSVVVRDVTGAGDAFVAGAAWAMLRGWSLDAAMSCGIEASVAALQVDDSVPEHLTEALLMATTPVSSNQEES
jgi:pseudouridine kinase